VFGVTDKFFDVDALGDKEFVALGYGNKILRTEDGGATWTLVGRLSTRASLTRLTFHGQKGWGVGHAGSLVATEDGGRTWRTLESPTEVSLFDVDFPSETRGYAVGDGSTVVWTEDGGRTWKSQQVEMSQIGVREDMSLAIENPIFYSVDFVDEETGWVTGEFGQIRFTRDGGKTWEAQHGTLLGAKYRDIMALPTLACVRMLDRTRGIAVGTYGAIATTVDGGQTWQFRDSPVADPLYDIRILPDGTSLIVGSSGIILRGTIDEGWSLAATPPGVFTWISSIDLAPSGNGVAVGGHGLVLTSADFGKNWLVTPYQ
jgi:photosystem II stability/assembly factor-like uncharacterized protein